MASLKQYLLALFCIIMSGCCNSPCLLGEKAILDKLYASHQKWQNTPYLLGGMNQQGIDCSGFTSNVFFENFNITLPRTTKKQSVLGKKISMNNLKAGDLVFFTMQEQGVILHVGIYLEKGRFLHASSSQGITISDLESEFWRANFWKASRMINAKL